MSRDWKPAFLATLAATGNVRLSSARAGIDRTTAYKARDVDADFAAAWDGALQDGIDLLEAKAREMALKGSERLMMFLLKAHRRDVYGDHIRSEVTGKDGGPIRVAAGDLEAATRELDQWRREMGVGLSSMPSAPPT